MGLMTALAKIFAPVASAQMNLAPLGLPSTPSQDPKSDLVGKYSSSGTQISSGQIYGVEKNPDLAGPGVWATTAKEMLRTDARLFALDRVTRHAIKSLTWQAVAPSRKAAAKRNTAFVNEMFGWGATAGRIEEPWEALVDKISNFTSVGFRTLEEVWKVEDKKVWLKTLADMEPESVWYWIPDQNTGELAFVQQRPWSIGEPRPRKVPSHKILVFTHNKTGRNYQGIGMFRPLYVWNIFTAHLVKQLMIAVERWASSVPLLTIDRMAGMNAAGDEAYDTPQADQMIKDARECAAAFRTGSAVYMVDNPVAKLSTYGEGQLAGIGDLIAALQLADKEKSTLYLCAWLELGVEATGSRAVGEVHHAAFRASVVNLADNIRNQISGQDRPGGGTIARALKANFYGNKPIPADEMPLVEHSGLKADALAESLPILSSLVGGPVVTQVDALQRKVLELLGVEYDEKALDKDGVTMDDLQEIKAMISKVAEALHPENGTAAEDTQDV